MTQNSSYSIAQSGIGFNTKATNSGFLDQDKKQVGDGMFANQPESKSFLATALTWHGSVTPKVLPRVMMTALYAVFVMGISHFFPKLSLPIAPFEYSGAVLGLLLVLRVNAGHDRWWESRKIWSAIVNQSRNLALVVASYQGENKHLALILLKWIAAWPHVIRESLRKETALIEVSQLLDRKDVESVRSSTHKPMFVAFKITQLLAELRNHRFDDFAYFRADLEKSKIVDAIGACERILSTRMPLVLAIKTRRFISLFLLLLPLALIDRAGWLSPFYAALISYPLFSLDEIGAELQNPFSVRNLSHLPLHRICSSIEANVKELISQNSQV